MKRIFNDIDLNINKYSIIIVDDDPDLVELFKEILEKNGYKVYGFTHPIIALEYIQNNPTNCNLVISEYIMPQLNGYELGKKIREINTNIKVILISAYDDRHESSLEFKFIQKPITINNLIETVEESLLTIKNQH
jgi:DNA-binding NtrC family response regulator